MSLHQWPHTGLPDPGKATEADIDARLAALNAHLDALGTSRRTSVADDRRAFLDQMQGRLDAVSARTTARAARLAPRAGLAACTADACSQGGVCPTPDACRLDDQRPAPWHRPGGFPVLGVVMVGSAAAVLSTLWALVSWAAKL